MTPATNKAVEAYPKELRVSFEGERPIAAWINGVEFQPVRCKAAMPRDEVVSELVQGLQDDLTAARHDLETDTGDPLSYIIMALDMLEDFAKAKAGMEG